MKLGMDYMSQIGQMHVADCRVCQDYCSGWSFGKDPDGSTLIVVSDGCSTGGHTDIGARITSCRLAQEVEQNLRIQPKLDARQILEYATGDIWRSATEQCLSLLGLAPHDMFATCMSCLASKDGAVVNVQGDGIVAIGEADGTLRIIKTEWISGKLREGVPFNPPFYPVYASRICRKDGTFQNFLNAYEGNATPFVVETTVCKGVDSIETATQKFSIEQGLRGLFVELDAVTLAQTRFIALFSDGVNQVNGIPMVSAVKECLAFKTIEGAFVRRRLRAAVRDWGKANHKPLDDLSCAVIMPLTESELT